MSMKVSPFLRNVLYADALMSGAAALVMLAGAPILGPLLELPVGLLRWAGVLLVPFVVTLVVVARRETIARLALFDIVAVNALWVVASFGMLLTGTVSPNGFGYAFVIVQAVAVAVAGELQFIAWRRARPAIA
jgi:hypothetical protein